MATARSSLRGRAPNPLLEPWICPGIIVFGGKSDVKSLGGWGWHGSERGREGKVWGAQRRRLKQKALSQIQAAEEERK